MHKNTKPTKPKSRIYVCHTFYHVYVSILKEMKFVRMQNPAQYKKADIALSAISTNFENLGDRLKKTGIFGHVFALDEKREDFFPELAKYRANYGNVAKHMINRMIFTKKLAKLEEPYLGKVNFRAYKDIYVFCDSDPIGYYLNYKHIYYHAVEDGLDCLKNLDDAYVANSSRFKLKTWFSRMNLIFVMNGWGKYCLDMEINDRGVVPTDCPRFVVEPRKPLERALTKEQKKLMIKAFIEDADALMEQLKPSDAHRVQCAQRTSEIPASQHAPGAAGCDGSIEGEEFACFLTEPHPVDVEARKRVCLDVIEKYCKGFRVIIKPHPRDNIDYANLCPEAVVLRGKFPVEVLNFFEGLKIKRAVSILTTAMNNMDFVEEKLNLGASFWDAYEDSEKHAYNKKAGLKLSDS